MEVTGSPGNPTPLERNRKRSGRSMWSPGNSQTALWKLSTPTWVFLSLPLHSPAPALFILPRWILLMDPLFHWFHLPFISNSLFWSPFTQISSNLSHTVKWIKDNFNYSYNVNFSISFPPPPWNPIQFQRIFREEGKEETKTDST